MKGGYGLRALGWGGSGALLLLVALHSFAPARPCLICWGYGPSSLLFPAGPCRPRLLGLTEVGSLALGRNNLAPGLRQGWASHSQP